jgi:hypothetical protein
MDVAYYLSELLGQLGEVNVPGLGYFVQLRIDGYYNENEAIFYPPHHQLHFDPQFINDDVLTQYIADKKNISLASSKYFTEKYINNLTQEALTKEVPLADIGWLYFDQRIRFKPAEVVMEDPTFYGYTAIAMSKLSSISILDQLGLVAPEPRPIIKPMLTPEPYIAPETSPEPPIKDEPVTSPEVYMPKPEVHKPYVPQPVIYTPQPEVLSPETEEQEEFIFRGKSYSGGDDDKPRRSPLIWVGLFFGILLIIALGLLGIYKFKPAVFKKLIGQKTTPVVLKLPVLKHDTVKHDTTKKVIAPAPDTIKKKPSAAIDNTAKVITPTSTNQSTLTIDSTKTRYEVIGTTCKTISEANLRIHNYKTDGITAHVLQAPSQGRLIKISLGTYLNRSEAIAAKNDLIKSRKVQSDIYIKEINPK